MAVLKECFVMLCGFCVKIFLEGWFELNFVDVLWNVLVYGV